MPDLTTAECAATPCAPPADRHASDIVQWSVRSQGNFSAAAITVKELPPAVYRIQTDQFGNIVFETVTVVTDELLRLPDTASDGVLAGIQRFWEAEERFRRFGQLFKRGVLLHGPPGSGKTVTVVLLASDIIKRGGIVTLGDHLGLLQRALHEVRKVEPRRPVVNIMEDIDDLIKRYDEAPYLALLDGETQVDNIVHIATTNYPENLDGRLKNRPSRFDEVVCIGLPSDEARLTYLRHKCGDALSGEELSRWVSESKASHICAR